MTTLRSWYASGKWRFVMRLAGVGAVAGLVSWLLVLALHLLVGTARPSTVALLLAVPRGALFGALLALALAFYWDRTSGRRENRRSGGR